MADVLIRDVEPALHARLAAGARLHDRSIEDEAHELLRIAAAAPHPKIGLAEAARRLFGEENGFDLELPPREVETDRRFVDFSGPDYDR